VFVRNHVCSRKYDDVAEEMQLLEANSMYVNVRHKDGRKQNVSLCDLAPCPRGDHSDNATLPNPDRLVDEIPKESGYPSDLKKLSALGSPQVLSSTKWVAVILKMS